MLLFFQVVTRYFFTVCKRKSFVLIWGTHIVSNTPLSEQNYVFKNSRPGLATFRKELYNLTNIATSTLFSGGLSYAKPAY